MLLEVSYRKSIIERMATDQKNKYERLFEKGRARVVSQQFILPYFGTEQIVLDIGSGIGFYSDMLKTRVKKVICLDSCSEYVDLLKKRGHEAVLADVNQGIPFSDKIFDAVVALEFIEHINRPENFIQEVSRVLRKDGILLISTPNRLSLEGIHGGITKFVTGRNWDAWDSSHQRIFSVKEFKELISKNFQIIKTIGYYFIPKVKIIPPFLSFISFSNKFLVNFCFITNVLARRKGL